ncbi:hypothetical protein MMC28_000442 [Mycoblastus sanguinarius]|nr:hypothetical protein [Mycoblastus sanguinarius]
MLRRIITVNSRSFLVTDSIYRALRALRHGDKKRIVWIDAVCINQGDHKEKIKQVQNLMQPIYEKAQRVIVWLGAAPADLSVAFDRVQQQIKGSTERNKERLGDREVWAPALQDILNRRWWSRVWVVQEVALGRRVILRCGDEEIGWESLSKFLASQTNTQSLDIKREVSSLIKFTTARRGGFPLRKRVGLLHLAAHFRDRTATDPRDKLFGLLGLVNKEKEPLEPDWTKAPLTVFADFAASCIERNKNLGILVLAEEQCASQCSWAVSWDAAVQKPNRISLWPPELYNNPITRVRKYSATQDLPAECKRNGDDWGSIFLAGWQEDAVAIVGDHTAFNILGNERQSIRHIVSTWEKLAGAHSKGSTREKQAAFNRTIVADACDGDHPEDWVEWVDKNMQTNSYQAHERAMASSIKEPDHQSPRKHNCVTVQQACTQRRFFITSNGRYGIGPTDTHVRDKVCMLLGAAVPFILRETDHRHKWTSRWCNRKVHPEGKEFHKVVGQAYVDGVMDYEGDSKADVGCGVVKLRDFLLE